MNKEKRTKREKPVNIENNSSSYFPILTVTTTNCLIKNQIKKGKPLV